MHVYYRSLGEIYLLETALYSVTLPVYYLYIQICHLFIIYVWSSVYHIVPVACASIVYTIVYAHITQTHTHTHFIFILQFFQGEMLLLGIRGEQGAGQNGCR